MEAAYNEEEVKQELKKTDASYILIIKSARYNIKANKRVNNGKQSLPEMIISGKSCPKWINIVKLPAKFHDVVVAKIDKKKLRGSD